MPNNETLIQNILLFWFGNISANGEVEPDIYQRWWQKDANFDEAIRMNFEEHLQCAIKGEYDHWAEHPKGRLALIVLLDQFSRNIYRNTPAAFAQDSYALKIALEGIEKEHDQTLFPIERVFMYLPLEHQEDKAIQQQSVALFENLYNEVELKHRALFANFLEYAKAHQRIIDRFSRFPHRNDTLGRPSTQKELTFLNEPGSSF